MLPAHLCVGSRTWSTTEKKVTKIAHFKIPDLSFIFIFKNCLNQYFKKKKFLKFNSNYYQRLTTDMMYSNQPIINRGTFDFFEMLGGRTPYSEEGGELLGPPYSVFEKSLWFQLSKCIFSWNTYLSYNHQLNTKTMPLIS